MNPDTLEVIFVIVVLAFLMTLPIVFGPDPEDFQETEPKEPHHGNENPDT